MLHEWISVVACSVWMMNDHGTPLKLYKRYCHIHIKPLIFCLRAVYELECNGCTKYAPRIAKFRIQPQHFLQLSIFKEIKCKYCINTIGRILYNRNEKPMKHKKKQQS